MSQSKKVEMTDSGLSVPNNVRIPFIKVMVSELIYGLLPQMFLIVLLLRLIMEKSLLSG